MIPFSEVRCDEVRVALAGHLWGSPDAKDVTYGRALGKVLAHELLHVINRSGRHAKRGFAEKYLSAAMLIDERLD